jgi:hypothetical protein
MEAGQVGIEQHLFATQQDDCVPLVRNKKGRRCSLWAKHRGLFLYFKLPVDCDDEESLEERRGRTMLRTAM